MSEQPDVNKALAEAVKVLYFDDNNDYGAALWRIVHLLGGKDAVNLLLENGEAAWKKYVEPEQT